MTTNQPVTSAPLRHDAAATGAPRPVAYRLEPFGIDGTPGSADVLADLHQQLLPTSPVAQFGPLFLKEFYYRLLPISGQIFGAIAYVNRKPAGFIAATDDRSRFARSGALTYWGRLCTVLLRTVADDPHRVLAIGRALRLLYSRQVGDDDGAVGEILSMGVASEFRTPEFFRSARIRISPDLLNFVMTTLSTRGIGQVRAYVDADNQSARLFYLSQGWQARGQVTGWEVPVIEYAWSPAACASERPSELASSTASKPFSSDSPEGL